MHVFINIVFPCPWLSVTYIVLYMFYLVTVFAHCSHLAPAHAESYRPINPANCSKTWCTESPAHILKAYSHTDTYLKVFHFCYPSNVEFNEHSWMCVWLCRFGNASLGCIHIYMEFLGQVQTFSRIIFINYNYWLCVCSRGLCKCFTWMIFCVWTL